MRTPFILLSIILPFLSLGQLRFPKEVRETPDRSLYKVCYRVPADSILKWNIKESINTTYLNTLQPVVILPDSIDLDSAYLPVGQYILVKSIRENIVATSHQVTQLGFTFSDNKKQFELLVFNAAPEPNIEGEVWLKHKKLAKNKAHNGFLLPKKWEDEWIMVTLNGDTLITEIEKEAPYNYRKENIWSNGFKNFPIVRSVRKIPQKAKGLFDGKPSRKQANKQRKKHTTQGFVIFNKPLYKPGDTLKLKAWLTNGQEIPLTETQEISLSFPKNNRSSTVKLGSLSPVEPGSFVYALPLPDSFPSDTEYSIYFKGKNKYAAFQSKFSIEEYQLPDISKFTFTASKNQWMYRDTLQFVAEATDASGLPLLDATIELILLTAQVKRWVGDTLFVPDTLYHKQIPMLTSGATTLSIPTHNMPPAEMEIRAVAILRNSNNEKEELQERITLSQFYKEIKFTRIENALKIEYLENDKSIAAKAMLRLENDNWSIDTLVHLPGNFTAHPLAAYYTVMVLDKLGRVIKQAEYETDEEENAGLTPLVKLDFNKDSIGFITYNPANVPLLFSVTDGKKIIWAGNSTDTQFKWYKAVPENKMYVLHYQYVQDGKTENKTIRMGLPYKWLQVNTQSLPVVQPGTKDTLLVKVSDYKNRPQSGVNLTAVAHNMQLSDKFNLPELPLVHNYKRTKYFRNPGEVDQDWPTLTSYAPLYPMQNIRKSLQTDTLPWYKWLFSTKALQIHRSIVKTTVAEVAVFAQKNGIPEPIYIVYVNNNPIWYYDVNTHKSYSQQVSPGYAKISIRVKNELITKDSVYLQPYYKHDIFINLSKTLGEPGFSFESKPDTLTKEEKNKLEKYFIRLEKHNDNQNAWLWQGNNIHQLNTYPGRDWIAGPFMPNWPIDAWKRDEYQLQIMPEANYSYRLSKGMIRLEKMPLFSQNIRFDKKSTFWNIGETIPDMVLPPEDIPLTVPGLKPAPILKTDYNPYQTTKGFCTVQLDIVYDSLIAFQIWLPSDSMETKKRIVRGSAQTLHQLEPGSYQILLVKADGRSVLLGPYEVQPNGLNCIRLKPNAFFARHGLVDSVVEWSKPVVYEPILPLTKPLPRKQENAPIKQGDAQISGYVKDAQSKEPIPGCSVMIKGSSTGTTTDENGYYSLNNIENGNYTIEVGSVGYVWAERKIRLGGSAAKQFNFSLELSFSSLDEVVVVGYGSVRKSEMTGSVAYVTSNAFEFEQMLQGKVAGVQISGNSGAGDEIRIRGLNTFSGDNQPLIVVDGVPMEMLPADLDTTMGNISIEVLKGSSATALYGSRAASGVIIINTGRNTGPTLRTSFSDYAYWQPNQTTDKDGLARIPISYPDNITNWQHAVYAAAPKGQYGRSLTTTKAFKAVQGQLSVPNFLIEGDSTYIIGKAMNYTNETMTLSATFAQSNQENSQYIVVNSMDAATPSFGILAPNAPDTLHPSFSVKDTKGTSDGEQRQIPVFAKGTTEKEGVFYLLTNADTTVTYSPARKTDPVEMYASTKLIDVLENELEGLIAYPYDCMEQTANKLWGLLMMREIKKATSTPFKYEKRIPPLLNKLLKNQMKDGGWSWWAGGEGNLHITTKVLQVLQQVPPSDATRKALREGYLFLQNKLPVLDKYKKLEALYALSRGGHVYPYKMALDTINFDSLDMHYKWQYYSVIQQHKNVADSLWPKLWKARNESATGALYWGNPSWQWYSSIKSTMVAAFHTMLMDSSKHDLLPKMQQYFLEAQQGGWGNTVERAEISNLLLQEAIRQNKADFGATKLMVTGIPTIDKFPAKLSLPAAHAHTFRKTGNGLMYLTAFQQWQNKSPQRVDSLFDVNTYLVQQGDTVTALKTGTTTRMQVNIKANKSAEFVMIEIPIPAGCVVIDKYQERGQHREYLKDKVVIFVEQLHKGTLHINIPIEVRYKGVYSLNPAKVELMYVPVLFGRNSLIQIEQL